MAHIQATGFYMIHQGIVDVKYGALYNWYAATDARYICSAGWHVPTKTEIETLQTYLGGASVAGGKLKEIGLIYWNTPNTGATNEVGFNGRGVGTRTDNLGLFKDNKVTQTIWSSTQEVGEAVVIDLVNAAESSSIHATYRKTGGSLRLIKDSTTLSHGQTGTYTGNDGKVYRTICIGTQEWLADNLCETLYRDGTPIPEVTDNSAWAALTTGAMCAYNNNWDNVLL